MNLTKSGDFYPSFCEKRSNYDPETFTCAEETVTALLEQKTTSDHPGMLLGKVQSGKTRTFVSALALAFDNGFDVAIILTKNSKALVEQTKKRLEDEFKEFMEDGELDVYDIMTAPESFSKFELDSKLIFVAKKQKDNLNKLINLFSNNCEALSQQKTLIIDDEADSASIGYTRREGLIEANTIAAQISQLRESIDDCSFLQVTATPYSLYLQPQEVEVANNDSFSPTRPAFTKLVPVPDAYVGGETYFGTSAQSSEPTIENLMHVPISHRELEIIKQPDRRRFRVEEALTSDAIAGLRSGIINFIVGGVIQRIKGIEQGLRSKTLRYSFLIHTESGKASHAWQETILQHLLEDLEKEAQKKSNLFRELIENAYSDLSRSLNIACESIPDFGAVFEGAHAALIDGYLTVSKVNSDEEVISLLDSTGQLKLRSPLNIFVGGQVLDRGITLDSLIGFYYGRRPNKFQQDTVLQHSRMYGYRRHDLPVTRFYTSHYIRTAMFEMEAFDSALRTAIENGHDQGVQFIRRADDGGIVPCNPNKILVATTASVRPFRRFLPIGFQSDYKSKIKKDIERIDSLVAETCGFNAEGPLLVDETIAIEILDLIAKTLIFDPNEDVEPFDWDTAKSILSFLTKQTADDTQRRKIWLWAARGRNSARFASESSHARFIETPDSEKTEGVITRQFASDNPILFLLRQEGREEKGWRGGPFYWPVLRAQRNIGTVIYTQNAID